MDEAKSEGHFQLPTVDCPICLKKFSQSLIEEHVEMCLTTQEKQNKNSNPQSNIETEHDFGYSFPQLKIDEEKRQYLHSQVVDSPFIDNKQQETFQKTFEALYTERQPQEKQTESKDQIENENCEHSNDIKAFQQLKEHLVVARSKLGLFSLLPTEILILILQQHFNRKLLVSLASTCSDFKLICENDYFWKRRYEADFQQSAHKIKPQLSWLQNYREVYPLTFTGRITTNGSVHEVWNWNGSRFYNIRSGESYYFFNNTIRNLHRSFEYYMWFPEVEKLMSSFNTFQYIQHFLKAKNFIGLSSNRSLISWTYHELQTFPCHWILQSKTPFSTSLRIEIVGFVPIQFIAFFLLRVSC